MLSLPAGDRSYGQCLYGTPNPGSYVCPQLYLFSASILVAHWMTLIHSPGKTYDLRQMEKVSYEAL